ncbi:unnamed protein product [Coregonus sp. 'balchen']|nr:unnamed protein product [Coregonus sp. 'balchen']
MQLSSKTPRALAAIFESPSDDEDFLGFAMSLPSDSESDDGRDSLASEDSGKPCVAEESDEDTGFYSEGEEPDTHKRRSLCVAFRFPTKRLSAQKGEAPKKPQPITTAPPERRTNERLHLKRGVSQVSSGMVTRGQKQPLKKEVEEEKEEKEVESPVLNKRAKNIQENKAMLAKLFADLTNMAELTPSTTKKRRVSEKPTPRRRGVYEGGERRNPSRAARPPEKFGVEEKSTSPSRHNRSVRTIDVRKLLEVHAHSHNGRAYTHIAYIRMLKQIHILIMHTLCTGNS